MLYAGVDHHTKTSHLTVIDQEGNVIKRKVIPSDGKEVVEALIGYGEPIKAVLEASYNWGKMYDWLDEVADEVVLAHPLKVRAIAEARIKNDKIDSRTLAHLLRADLIPEAYACPAEIRAIKRVLRQRMFLVRIKTMLKNRVHALLHQHDLEEPNTTDLFGVAGRRWLKGLHLPSPDGEILSEDLALLDVVRERIASTEGLIKKLSMGDHAVKWLKSIPGIGDFFSVLIRNEVGDISRFRSPKKFVSYTGLIPSTYASAGKVYHGRITKQGNKYLRWAFIEAVTPAIRISSELKSYYERLKRRKGTKDARVATARKLAEICWYVWTEERFYEVH
ncbi:MAG: IS110 family transposase [Actinomycetota bacterium]|nr:IS110 family transposase [Actinomycetota bacterium]